MVNKLVFKKHQGISVGYAVLIIVLTFLCFSMLYPFINLLFQSVSKPSDILSSNGFMLYPKSFETDSYEYLLKYPYMSKSYSNTLFITVVGTTLALTLTSIGAYVLSRRDLPGRSILTTFVVITMFFSGGMIPTYINLRSLRLLNTLWCLILPFSISTWNMLLTRNFFMGIPIEISEAAKIDGASEVRLFIRIILPLSKPILSTIALFYAVGRWNEYSSVIVYNSKSELQTLQVIIRKMYDTVQSTDEMVDMPPLESIRAAAVMVTVLPILCVYPMLQKYFAQGIMVGSVKG